MRARSVDIDTLFFKTSTWGGGEIHKNCAGGGLLSKIMEVESINEDDFNF